jgi:hypothetical protein
VKWWILERESSRREVALPGPAMEPELPTELAADPVIQRLRQRFGAKVRMVQGTSFQVGDAVVCVHYSAPAFRPLQVHQVRDADLFVSGAGTHSFWVLSRDCWRVTAEGG